MNARKTALAVAASLAMLSGCGGEHSGEAVHLDAGQAEAVLPDVASLPGWETSAEPAAYSLKKAKAMGIGRCYEGTRQDSCTQVRFFGSSAFHQQGKPEISFIVQTYRDEASARAAYGTVWQAWKQRVPAAKAVSTGEIGDQRDGVIGLDTSMIEGSKGLLVQVRVDSVIMLSMATAGPQVDMADSFLNQFADVFAKRAGQAQAGKKPSQASTSEGEV
ncbi:hypothetical protein [Streptomyces olivaceoviridis]|uniref:hypothetical protein n=1 Tax=Streptomyces olivaceoviridis TaxID=1921 RepID=UPI0036F9ADF1